LIFSAAINLEKMIFGSSYSSKSLMGRFDPRIKMLSAMALIIAIALTLNVTAYLIISFILIPGIMISGIPLRIFLSNIRPFLFLILITFILHLLFSSVGDKIIIEAFGKTVTVEGLQTGGMFAWRIILFFITGLLFTMTTDPVDISDGLVRLLKPLRKIKIRTDQIGLVIFMTFRFIPLLAEESRAIYTAQLSRGYDPSKGLLKRLKNAHPLLTAIFASTFRRADQIVVALEARGFCPDRERTSYRQFKIKSADWYFIATILAVSVLSVILGIYA
jgi:energy-coupling factor transport system permease protein